MKVIVLYVLLVWSFTLHAQYDFQAVHSNLSGQALSTALVQDFRPTVVKTYGEARDILYGYVYKENDSVACIYSDYKRPLPSGVDPSTYIYLNGSDNGINCEHSYPQSKGAGDGNPRSDMHHLFPAKSNVNEARWNNKFAEIADNQTDNWYFNTIETGNIPNENIRDLYSESTYTAFEPRESVKGNIARAVFYFYTMYRIQADNADPSFFASMRPTLCDWHYEDPVDSLEWLRTSRIALHQQGKKNPYILDCTLAQRVFCPEIETDCDVSFTSIDYISEWGLSLSNQPNPFKKETKIQFSIGESLDISISIYDAKGQLLKLVENQKYNAGTHIVDYEANQLSSGLLFYVLKASNGLETVSITKKMVVR